MRLASIIALAAAATVTVALASGPAEAQKRRGYRVVTERITIIDESGRRRTRITVRPRSYLDGGTWVLPGERKFMDYAMPPTWTAHNAYDPTGARRHPLPGPFELPGYSPYSYW